MPTLTVSASGPRTALRMLHPRQHLCCTRPTQGHMGYHRVRSSSYRRTSCLTVCCRPRMRLKRSSVAIYGCIAGFARTRAAEVEARRQSADGRSTQAGASAPSASPLTKAGSALPAGVQLRRDQGPATTYPRVAVSAAFAARWVLPAQHWLLAVACVLGGMPQECKTGLSSKCVFTRCICAI